MKLYATKNGLLKPVRLLLDGSVMSFRVGDGDLRSIDLSSLRELPDFTDRACFTFYDRESINGDFVHPEIFTRVHNVFAATFASKASLGVYHATVTQVFPVVSVLVPFAESPVSEWAIVVGSHEPVLADDGNQFDVRSADSLASACGAFFPKVAFDARLYAADSDGIATVGFRLVSATGDPITDRDCNVYLDATAGNLARKRVRTERGVGTVSFSTAGLKRGEKAQVKCGFKFWSGTDDCEVVPA